MKVQLGGRAFLVAAALGSVTLVAAATLVALGVRSVVAGPGSAPAAALPNPGHSYSQIELPAGTWTGLNADKLDGMHAGQAGGSYILYADASGNVGIGTTQPEARLEVNGVVHARPAIWSGGCSHDGTGPVPGHITYCTDRQDFNTAQDYLSVASNGTFTVLVPGYYRINAQTMGRGPDPHWVNLAASSGEAPSVSFDGIDGKWMEISMDVVWPFNAGDTFFIWYSNPGEYAYYRWSSLGNSWLQVSYVGIL